MDHDKVAETEPPRVFSSRDFLGLAGKAGLHGFLALIGVDSFIAHLDINNGPTLTEDFWNQLETFTLGMSEQDTRNLKEKVQEKFKDLLKK